MKIIQPPLSGSDPSFLEPRVSAVEVEQNDLNAQMADKFHPISYMTKIKNESPNLFNPNDVVTGGYYEQNNGSWIVNASLASSGLIPIEEGKTYTNTSSGLGRSFYRADGGYVQKASFPVPTGLGIKNMRVTVSSTNNAIQNEMVVEGSSLPSTYNPYKDGAVYQLPLDNFVLEGAELGVLKHIQKIASPSLNLLDLSKLTTGGYYRYTGVWTATANTASSDFIKVEEGATYKHTHSSNITYWDSDKNYISGIDGVTTNLFTVPVGAKYVRISLSGEYLTSGMLVKGISLPAQYEPYSAEEKFELPNEKFSFHLPPSAIQHIETIPSGANLLDLSKSESGGYYSYNTGAWTAGANIASSALIPVDLNTTYTKNTTGGQLTYWDVDGNYVSGVDILSAQTFTTPATPSIKSMRMSIVVPSTQISNAMVVKGSALPTEYVPFAVEKYKFSKDKFILEPSGTYKTYTTPEVKEYSQVVNPIITTSIVTDRTDVDGVADPFIVFDKGRYHLFFEVLGGVNPNTSATSDEIGHAYSDDLINWTYTQVVISHEIHGHRSAFPNVFKYNDEWYMVPDTAGNIKLYKATNFPLVWEFQADLVTGTFVDTNVFKVNDLWFLTTSKILGDGANDLTLYYNASGEWRNNLWKEHPLGNIIARDDVERGKRNAGNIFHGGDYIIMPLQITPVASGIYGEYTDWYKLSNLTGTTCTVTRLGRAVDPSHTGNWKDGAMHQISHVEHDNGTIYAVDGWNSGVYSIGLYKNA